MKWAVDKRVNTLGEYRIFDVQSQAFVASVARKEHATLVAAAPQMLDALVEALEFAEDYEDVVDGDYGQPAPNKAMVLCVTLRAVLIDAGVTP